MIYKEKEGNDKEEGEARVDSDKRWYAILIVMTGTILVHLL